MKDRKRDSTRIMDLIDKVVGYFYSSQRPIADVLHTRPDVLYDLIKEWMNQGPNTKALDRDQASRLFDKLLEIGIEEIITDVKDMTMDLKKKNDIRSECIYALWNMTQTEQTQWIDNNVRLSGIRLANTRIVESFWDGPAPGPRVEVFNSYMEFDRMGPYHAYWDRDDAQRIVDYLTGWLRRSASLNKDYERRIPKLRNVPMRNFPFKATRVDPDTVKQLEKKRKNA